jgi:hypothetical protein
MRNRILFEQAGEAPGGGGTPTAQTQAPADTTHAQLAALQADNAALAKQVGERDTALAQALRERDALKNSVGELEPRAKQADELKVKFEGMVNEKRETALFSKVREAFPGADPLALRGVLRELGEAGRVQRYAEQTDAEAAKAIELIKTEAPGLTRPAHTAGGSAGAAQTPARQPRRSLVG